MKNANFMASLKAFFGKAWTATKAFSIKAGKWIIANKVISIPVAVVLVGGIACAIALPIALHEHKFSEEWTTDEVNHWHNATCSHEEKADFGAHVYDNDCDTTCNVCGATRTVGAHAYDNACDTTCNACGATRAITHDHADTLTAGDTTHYYLCSVCGDKKDEVAHVFDKSVASSEYLHTEATATTKGVYYKSCVCGAKSATETFELEKTVATITNIQDLSTQYTSQKMLNPTFDTNSDGTATFAWYNSANQLLPNAPASVGTYKVKISIPETVNYQAITEEREFVISKRVLTIPTSFEKVYDGTNDFSFTIDASNSGTGKEVVVDVKFVDFSTEPVDIKNAGSYDETEGTFTINQIREAGVSTANYELDLANADFEVVITKKAISNVVFSLGTNNTGTLTLTVMSFHGKGIIGNDKLEFTLNIDSDTLTAGQEYSVTTNQADAGAGGPYYVEIEDTSVGLDNYDIDWSTIKVKCTASL